MSHPDLPNLPDFKDKEGGSIPDGLPRAVLLLAVLSLAVKE